MRVNLKKLPDPNQISSISIQRLHGGLNLRSEPTEVGAAQSPDMLNMWYQDGMLRKRPGQMVFLPGTGENRASGQVWFYERLFGGYVLYQDGMVFRYLRPGEPESLKTVEGITVPEQEHGTFFPFDEYVFYKARGVYIRFLIDESGSIAGEYIINGGEVSDKVYTPIISINRKPDGTGGDLYQPENRISPDKWVWFDIDEKSKDYYLPVHGCEVLKVQVEDEVVDTTEHKSFVTSTGIGCEIIGESLNDTAAEYTRLRFTTPVYFDDTGWSSSDWSENPSNGGNYIGNIVWSSTDLKYLNDDYKSVLKNGDLLYGASNQKDLPEELKYDMIQMAWNRSGFEEYESFFVLDNGKYMNVFFEVPPPAVIDENGDASAGYRYNKRIVGVSDGGGLIVNGMVMVSYNYANGAWSTKDYTKSLSSGQNYVSNCVYASRNFELGNYKPPNVIIHAGAPKPPDTLPDDPEGIQISEKYYRYRRVTNNLVDYAREKLMEYGKISGWDGKTDKNPLLDEEHAPLKFIAENENIYVFRYKIPEERFWITDYDKANGYFKAKGYLSLTIRKDNPQDIQFEIVHEPGKYGSFVKNIIWASEDMIYYNGVSGDRAIEASITREEGQPLTINDVPEQYRDQVMLAMRRAYRDYGSGMISFDPMSDIVIAEKSPYLNVYFQTPGGMRVTEYDVKTGNFKAVGFVLESYNANNDVDVSISFATPSVLSNRVRVLYRKRNEDAMNAIMSCKAATSYGGSNALCVVMGGCEKQPNAIFWSGNGSYGVDPTYFPMNQYNLCGTYQDPVVGFGKQQSRLVIFQKNHISRASYNIERINGRDSIDLPVVNIHGERGCDRPWSIRLCGNNLVWAHSKYGILYLKDTTSAYENMVITISDNVNGNDHRPGMLAELAKNDICFAVDDGKRYMIFIGDKMYAWDHAITSVGDDGVYGLSWTRHSGFDAEAASTIDSGGILLMNRNGMVNDFSEEYTDDNGLPIPCHYTTPTQSFGGYYRKRSIREIILTAMSDMGGQFRVRCGGERVVPRSSELNTPARPIFESKIEKREFPTPLIYKPRMFGINHLWVRVESDGDDGGIAIDGMTILYTSHGKVR